MPTLTSLPCGVRTRLMTYGGKVGAPVVQSTALAPSSGKRSWRWKVRSVSMP